MRISVVVFGNNIFENVEKCLDNIFSQTHTDIEVLYLKEKQSALDLPKSYQIANHITILDYDAKEMDFWENILIQRIRGKFVLFLNTDCCLRPDAIEKMAKKAVETDAQIVFSEYTEKTSNKVHHFPNFVYSNKELFSNHQKLLSIVSPELNNKLINVDVIRKNNLVFDFTNKKSCGIGFAFLTLYYANKIAGISECLIHFPRSTTAKLYQNSIFNLVSHIEWLYQQVKSRSLMHIATAYSVLAMKCLKEIPSHTGVGQLIDNLHLIKQHLSQETFKHIFHAEHNFLACHCVSIIIPVYNAEKYLKRCLDSAIHQTLEDIEIICIDDGSTDNSLKILKEYEKKDKRITVAHQENKGQSIARNQGLRVAAGEYIQFLDADDYLEPDSCEILYLYSKLLDLQMCPMMTLCHNGEGVRKKCQSPNGFLDSLAGNVPLVYNKTHLKDKAMNLCHAPWATFYSRKFLIDYNIHFINKKLVYCEDLPFFMVALMKAERIGSMLHPLYHYCFTAEGSTAQYRKSPTIFCDMIYCFLYTLGVLDKLGGKELFNLYTDQFSRSVLADLNQSDLERKKVIEKDAFKFYSTLTTDYHYILPKSCHDWCLQYLKKKPILKLKYLFRSYYNKIRKNYLSKIITCRTTPFGDVINFCGLPVGRKETKGKVTRIILFKLTFLKIQEE